jgi:glycosyltransferase involved in cell wall biosynthesis
MIHNMEPLANINEGNPFLEKIKNWVRAKLAKKAVQNADHLIAVSEYVRDFLKKYWNIPHSKMSVIYHGLNQPHDKNNVRPVVIPETWNDKFLFTAGAIRPSRGLEDIISAITYLVSEDTHHIDNMMIAGTTHSTMNKYRQSLQKMIENNKISNHIFFAGNLNEQEMSWCYQNCSAFIMTSRVEACPNVALEAMSHGCLCISADNPPLPEIFAEGALYYQSKDGKSLAEAIQTVYSWDNHQRHRRCKRTKRRAADFSWDITANKTVQELQKVMDDCKYQRS